MHNGRAVGGRGLVFYSFTAYYDTHGVHVWTGFTLVAAGDLCAVVNLVPVVFYRLKIIIPARNCGIRVKKEKPPSRFVCYCYYLSYFIIVTRTAVIITPQRTSLFDDSPPRDTVVVVLPTIRLKRVRVSLVIRDQLRTRYGRKSNIPAVIVQNTFLLPPTTGAAAARTSEKL